MRCNCLSISKDCENNTRTLPIPPSLRAPLLTPERPRGEAVRAKMHPVCEYLGSDLLHTIEADEPEGRRQCQPNPLSLLLLSKTADGTITAAVVMLVVAVARRRRVRVCVVLQQDLEAHFTALRVRGPQQGGGKGGGGGWHAGCSITSDSINSSSSSRRGLRSLVMQCHATQK